MLDSPVIDTAIGLAVVFYVLALICAGVVELLANLVKKRSKYLLRGIRDLLRGATSSGLMPSPGEDAKSERNLYQSAKIAGVGREGATGDGDGGQSPITVESIMAHPMVMPYKQSTPTGRVTRNPSYLPSGIFADVVVDLLMQDGASKVSMDGVRTGLASLEPGQLREALSGLARLARDDADAFVASVQTWFDAQMDRVTGSYKRWAKRWVLLLASVIVVAGGVDSVAIARTLYVDESVRTAVTETVTTKLCPDGTDPGTCAENAQSFFEESRLPLGWQAPRESDGAWGIPLKILGLLLSIGAASLGAPFWYRVLDRIGTMRNTGLRPSSTTR